MSTKPKLKRLRDQVIVITGAASGIGMATAKLAAARGATVVLTSRDAKALEQLTAAIRRDGGSAVGIAAEVSDFGAVIRVRDFALTSFGRFDTWINNAGIHLFGAIRETPPDGARRLFDVNFWGSVHGCRAAMPQLKQHGGALINIGSVLWPRSVALQGFYGASKHALQDYTSALRAELAAENAAVSVTLIKPSSIDTPIPRHLLNRMEARARPPFPTGSGMRRGLFRRQTAAGPPGQEHALHQSPQHPPQKHGDDDDFARRAGVLTWAQRHRATAAPPPRPRAVAPINFCGASHPDPAPHDS